MLPIKKTKNQEKKKKDIKKISRRHSMEHRRWGEKKTESSPKILILSDLAFISLH